MIREKNCPSCNSFDIFKHGLEGEKKIFRNGEVEFIQDKYSIFKCQNCGLYFRSPTLTNEQLNLHYATYDYDNLHHENSLFPPERFIKKYLLKRSNKKRETILDYGCNEALFLSLLVKDFDCFGFEIDERVKSVAESRGIKMLNSTDLKKSDNKYNYIILIDVFEHLKNPTETISLLVLNLKKKGKLIISTGYADAKCCNDNLAGYWYFADCVQHLSMIGNDYINYLLKTFNLKILLQKSISHYDETSNMNFIDRTKFYLKYKIFEGSRIINKVKILSDFIKLIPLIRKPLLWKSAPPKIPLKQKKMEQDHIILILEKQ